MKKSPITLVLLGDIAAGKGTQAKLLVKKFHLSLIEVGAYARKILAGDSKVSKRLEKVKLGKLAPSDFIQSFLKRRLARISKNHGIIVDGGKMPAEARLIDNIFKKQGRKILVIYLTLPRSEIFKRLSLRYYCEKTGEPLVVQKRRSCPKCGGPIIKRADDDPRAVRNRIDYYDKIYSKTVKFWLGEGVLRKVNGKQSVSEVTKDIKKIIKDYYG